MALPPYAVDNKYVLKDTSSDIKWRHGLPDYSKTIALFARDRSTNHAPGSLEEIVENVVKNWEIGEISTFEIILKIRANLYESSLHAQPHPQKVSHKLDPQQWETVDVDNYRFSCNGQHKFTADDLVKLGTYNALIGKTTYYNASMLTLAESQMAFLRAFGEGFAWELIELYSGPPNVTFKWRHFGRMTGCFSCPSFSGYVYKAEPTNKMVSIYGICKATVTSELKIQDLQAFFDINQLFAQFTELCPLAPFANLSGLASSPTEKIISESLINNAGSSLNKPNPAMNHEDSQVNRQSATCTII
ncbi:unnamed protein product [Rotaria sp. Silwood2]|nr:unnamed protein product [Rotaria sp. Silwood2]